MREIKFRAWLDKSRMNFSGDTYGEFLDFFTICRQCNDGFGNCYLMQFTGLLDKNGKEIYEGDIYDWNGKIREAKWDNDFSCWRIFHDFKNIEIIGNIHENPELLNTER